MDSKKSIALLLILILTVSSLIIIDSIPFSHGQSGTNVSGIIAKDTTWTSSGSPYTLTGNTLVYRGVTLTVQSGVTVNLGSYYIEVNGTLSAIGNSNEKVTFNGGQIIFTTISNGWNEQTNSGCLIENSVISQTSISCSNPIKIDNSIINSQITVASSIITNNIVTGDINCHSAIPTLGQDNAALDLSVVSNNNVKGNIVLGLVSVGAISAPAEACIVSNNMVEGSIISGSPQGNPQIFNNTVSKGGIGCDGYGSIFNNYVYGCQVGISLYTLRVFGGNLPCYATVENNLVTSNSKGISIDLAEVFGGGTFTPTVQNNTVTGNSIGISFSELGYDKNPTIQYNNLQNNSNYNFYSTAPNNVNATLNWWGTTDTNAINQTIYDAKNDFNLGPVTFVPFSTEHNPQAPSVNTVIQTPTPTPTLTLTPTPTPTLTSSSSQNTTPSAIPAVPEFPPWTILSFISVMVIFASLTFYLRKYK